MGREELAKINVELNERIIKNIEMFLEANNITYYRLQKKLKEKETHTISLSFLNKVLNHPKEHSMPLPYLMQCCDFFGVTLDDMVNSTITLENYSPKQNAGVHKLINTVNLLNDYDKRQLNNETIQSQEKSEESSQNSLFIENPNNSLFSSFLQQYFCYFYPTVSSENKINDSILSGTLTLERDMDKCKVTLKVDTKIEKNNKKVYKIYEGTAVISSAVNNIHCTLKSEEIGEFCYIIFRHFHLNFALQDCHIAAVLTTSSAGNNRERYPTLLRMFLSREEISQNDLKLLAPHLWLNYSQITISEKGLLALKNISDEYDKIVNDLFNKADSDLMYLFKEKDVIGLSKNYLMGEEVVRFITELRLQSYAYHYNKVSDTVETTVRNLLISLGYYQDQPS